MNPHVLVMASAGTGKTFQLTSRLLALLSRGVSPDAILAATFTRKAAGEMLDRALSRLAEAATNADKLEQLRAHVDPALTSGQCASLLADLLRRIDRVSVMTMDALFMRLASAHALEIGAPSRWRIIDDEHDDDLRSESVAEALEDGDLEDLAALIQMLHGDSTSRNVHHAALAAVDRAYAAFLDSIDSPDAWQRFAHPPKSLDRHALERAIATIQAIQDRDFPTSAKGDPDSRFQRAHDSALKCVVTHDWESFLSTGLAHAVLAQTNEYYKKTLSRSLIDAYQPLVQHAAAEVLRIFHRRNLATRQLLERFHRAYLRRKLRLGALRFDDVPRLLLAQPFHGVLDHLYYRLDARFDHLLLDEFQDTSITQLRLLQPLLDEITTDRSRSTFIVGDAKQSLYAWRDAEPELMPALPSRWPALAIEHLDKSWRSSQVIIDAVNAVFSRIADNPALGGNLGAVRWQDQFHTHQTARAELPGWASLTIVAHNGLKGDRNQARFTLAARRAADLRNQAPAATIGILVRKNKHIRPIVHALQQLDVPFSEEGGNPLSDSPPVSAAVSLLYLADHPADSAAAHHVATSPLGDVLDLLDSTDAARVRRVSADLRRRFLHEGYAPVLRDLARRAAYAMTPRGCARFGQLIQLAAAFDADGGGRASRLARIIQSRRVLDPASHAVRVMTIHTAKGLEFDAVILPDLNNKWELAKDRMLIERESPLHPITGVTIYPNELLRRLDPNLERLHQAADSRQVEEELCALYVAMTRAVSVLEMFVDAPPASGQLERSAAGVLLAALAKDPHAEGLAWRHEHGDWLAHLESRPSPTPALADRVVPVRRPRAARRPVVRSPSDLHAPRTVADLLRPAPRAALASGVVIHALFQRVEWLDQGIPSDEALSLAARRAGAPPDQAPALIVRFKAHLDRLRPHLSTSAYAHRPGTPTVRREWRFMVRDDDTIISGQIDRLVISLDNAGRALWAHVIDFKSDAIPDESALCARAEQYSPQLLAYQRAASLMLSLDPADVTASLIFIDSASVVDFPSTSQAAR